MKPVAEVKEEGTGGGGDGMSQIDIICKRMVDDFWGDYDTDRNGTLDKQEAKKFIQQTLGEMGEDVDFNEADFEACFQEFDRDGNGVIDKDEIVQFIKKV